jgi:hypothetical protein
VYTAINNPKISPGIKNFDNLNSPSFKQSRPPDIIADTRKEIKNCFIIFLVIGFIIYLFFLSH